VPYCGIVGNGRTAGIGRVIRDNVREIAKEFDLTWRFPVVILGGASVVALVFLIQHLRLRHQSEHDPGRLLGAHLVALEDGSHVVLVTEVVAHATKSKSGAVGSFDTARLDSIDTADGHRRARAIVDRPLACVAATPGLAWCATSSGHDKGLELRDAATLAVRAPDAKQVPRGTGEAWTIQEPLVNSIAAPTGGTYSFAGSPRAMLVFNAGTEDAKDRPIARDTKFLSPGFISDGDYADHGPALRLGADQLVVVAHDDSVDHDTATLNGRGTPVVDQRLVLGIATKPGAIVAIDLSDGTVTWRTGT
jgi:hypothetical protein